jgi:hypothetical protein
LGVGVHTLRHSFATHLLVALKGSIRRGGFRLFTWRSPCGGLIAGRGQQLARLMATEPLLANGNGTLRQKH